ncbi:hypothetical protein KY320_02160 [Candidatus Woesearchaeota archaeon]|nr:hypothetical protein [Candidatus Woesearchaeota archaeon]
MNLAENWVEYVFITLVFLGLLMARAIESVVLGYIIISICGVLCGHLIFKLNKRTSLPYVLIAFGFLLGYALGSYNSSKVLIVLLFFIFSIVGYYADIKGYL